MEAFNFTVANEDCNLYTYDMRKLQSAACMHKASLTQPRHPGDMPEKALLLMRHYSKSVQSAGVSAGIQ